MVDGQFSTSYRKGSKEEQLKLSPYLPEKYLDLLKSICCLTLKGSHPNRAGRHTHYKYTF